MSNGRRLPDVCVIAELFRVHSGLLRPHRRHRYVVVAFDLHPVSDEGTTLFVRFAVMAHSARMQNIVDLVVVIFGEKVA